MFDPFQNINPITNKKFCQLRKTLPLYSPCFNEKAFRKPSYVLRKIFQYSFMKKIRAASFEADLAHHLPNSLRKITLAKRFPLGYGVLQKPNKIPARRSLESQKNLKQLEIKQDINLDQIKTVRKLQNLERLTLEILESDIPSIYNHFRRGMNYLHSVQLKILKDKKRTLPWAPQQIDRTWMFLKDLTRIKNLKALNLNIQDCFITQDPHFLYHLLGMLGNIETLGLILHLPWFEDNEQNTELLSQVQDLDLISHQYHVINTDFYEINSKEKKIRISFLPNRQQENIDITKLITKCSALKTLKIDDNVGKLIITPYSKFTAQLESLKVRITYKDDLQIFEFLRYLSNNSLNQHIKNFSMSLYHFTNEILEELVKMNLSFSPNQINEYSIYTLDLNHCNPNFDQTQRANFFSKLPRSELFCQLFESISRFTLLTNLNILTRIEEIESLESLANSLKSLQSLKDLTIEIPETGKTSCSESLLVDIPVYKLHKLQSLTLKLSFNFRSQDFFGFLEKMAEVQELRSFALDCVDIDPTDQESIKRIAKILDKFPICKRILVNREDKDESLRIHFIEAESLRKKLGK